MKSQNKELKSHYYDMKVILSQLKACSFITAQAHKAADKKGLEEIADHINKAEVEIKLAYNLISPEIKLLVEE